MALARNKNFDVFSEILERLNHEISLSGKVNLLSQNIHAEYFYRDLLNMLFDFKLRNENEIDPNSDAIDLLDLENKISFQVSSTCTKVKMEETLKKERIEKLAQDGYSVKFIFIGEQNIRSKSWKPANPYYIEFDSKMDIYLTVDLSRKFLALSIDKQERVIEFLYKETGKKFKLSDEIINQQLESSIKSLGPRYTPEANIKTDNSLIFEALLKTDFFWSSLSTLINEIIKSINKLKASKFYTTEGQQYIDTLLLSLVPNYELIKSFNDVSTEAAKIEIISKINGCLEEVISSCNIFTILESKINSQIKDELISLYRNIENTSSALLKFFEKTKVETMLNPYLLIQGEAGIGKSHLLADFCSKARKEGHTVFLLLGQHFVSDEDPWDQVMKQISPGTSSQDFIDELVRYSDSYSRKAVIVIDALNEGEGRRLWPNHFQRFFDRLRNQTEIHFIFSVRSTYLDEIIPEYMLVQNSISKYEHIGFENVEFDAINAYCNYYNLLPPVLPMLDEEFHNPLFLKLVCSMLHNKGISRLQRGYSLKDVYSSYLDEINKKLAAIDYLDYDSNINLIEIVLYTLVSEIDKAPYGQIDYQIAFQLVKNASSEYCDKNKQFLTALIDQNILHNITNYKGDTIVYFTYERLGDYYHVDWLLRNYKYDQVDLLNKIRKDTGITKYLSDPSTMSFNNGLIEMLSIMMPEKLGIELFEIASLEMKSETYIVESFLKSLYWRKVYAIKLTQRDYINETVLKYRYSLYKYLDVLIDLSFDSLSAFNSKTLDKMLKRMPFHIRDAYWTTHISIGYEAAHVEKYISWVWDNYLDLPADSVELIETTLLWFLSSTNRRIRDYSTKALTCLFIQRPSTAYSLLMNSSDINDPYIIERMYAALLGAIVHSSKDLNWKDVVLEVYNSIFHKDETMPNIMIRDYARCIVEYAISENIIDEVDVPYVKPPYKSKWYNYFPHLDDIDEIQKITDEKYKKHSKESIAVYHITSSMTTEYGRGTGAYGDFGRYTFGSALHNWSNQFDDQDLSNIVTHQIFDKYFDIKLHSDFDYRISQRLDRHDHRIERLGKKYQWIGLYELLARLGDNYPPYKENTIYKPEYQNIEKQRLQRFKAFIQQKDIFEDNFESYRTYKEEPDVLVDDSQYVERIEKQPILNYERPWEYYLRDIDPTFIWHNNLAKTKSLLPTFWTETIDLEWIISSSIYDDLNRYREFLIDGKKYISLYSYTQNVKNANIEFRDRDSVTFLSGSFIINNNDRELFLKKKDLINGNGIPTISYSNCYLYEYYWSSTCYAQKVEYDTDYDEEQNYVIGTNEYLWEPVNDDSLPENESVHLVLPNEELVNYFKLQQDVLGIWKNNEMETICFDSSHLGYYEQFLLFDKEKLCQYLSNTNSTIVWGEYFEKISSGNRHEWWFKTDYCNGDYIKYIIDERKWSNDK